MKNISLVALSLVALAAITAPAQEPAHKSLQKPAQMSRSGQIQHVLLISVDGMHAVDFQNCANGIAGVNGGLPYCPNLASLAAHGINYVAASTSKPSDSFPGLMSIVSGATPRTMGVYYDVAYDRSLDAPAKTTGNGVAAGPCKKYGAPTGTTTEYEEGIDIDQSKLNGGAPGAGLTEGSIASIDPARLPRDPARGCAPVWPWEFVRTNTIFGVIHEAGGYTAWSDKHPAYSSIVGYTGPNALDDFFGPEINSTVVGLPGIMTPAGMDCSTVPDPSSDVSAWTNSFENIQCYDTIKVNAILNQIDGKWHNGSATTQTPTIFGMNFQALSVGQKLIEAGQPAGGYLNATGAPAPATLSEIQFVDDSIGEMIGHLQNDGLWDSTLIVITAKHGQSPIDTSLYSAYLKVGSSPATVLDNAKLIPFSEAPSNPTGIGPTEDDVSLIWLKSPSETAKAVSILKANASMLGLGQYYFGSSLAMNFNVPGLPPNDPRTPDIIVTPNIGVTYSGSSKKHAEHGGFSHDDTNVVLLVAGPETEAKTIYTSVTTSQIAPTILKTLGLDPRLLDGVRLEGTAALPK